MFNFSSNKPGIIPRNKTKLEVRELNHSLLKTTEGSFTMYVSHGKLKTDRLTDHTEIAC